MLIITVSTLTCLLAFLITVSTLTCLLAFLITVSTLTCLLAFLITVSTLTCLLAFLIIGLNGSEKCVYDFCLSVSLLCLTYIIYWLLSYIYCKKKTEELTVDLDNLFARQEELIERLRLLSQKQEHG